MQVRKTIWWVEIILITGAMTACNLGATPPPTEDVGMVQTQAMQVVNTQIALQQTQSAVAAAPTSLPSFTPAATATRGIGTPLPFSTAAGFTPLATVIPTIATFAGVPADSFPVGCNDSKFVGETKPFDKDTVKLGKEFSKAWMFLNNGTCTWEAGYAFIFREDLSTSGIRSWIGVRDIKLTQDKTTWTKPGHNQTFVMKITPSKTGEYKAFWQMKAKTGEFFGSQVYVWFIVE